MFLIQKNLSYHVVSVYCGASQSGYKEQCSAYSCLYGKAFFQETLLSYQPISICEVRASGRREEQINTHSYCAVGRIISSVQLQGQNTPHSAVVPRNKKYKRKRDLGSSVKSLCAQVRHKSNLFIIFFISA